MKARYCNLRMSVGSLPAPKVSTIDRSTVMLSFVGFVHQNVMYWFGDSGSVEKPSPPLPYCTVPVLYCTQREMYTFVNIVALQYLKQCFIFLTVWYGVLEKYAECDTNTFSSMGLTAELH